METQLEYLSFNSDKSIDELLYTMKQTELHLKNIETELRFLKFLIDARIYKEKVMNLFENLTLFDKKVDRFLNEIEDALMELNNQTNLISKKIECEDLECDAFFINEHNKIESEFFNLIKKSSIVKLELFQYLKSVIKNV
ncbi:hypothetical protein [Lacinutrix sp. Bg11-31]|uniref:hypothetical protein n=1 Tax=Lacinutrix sp. Bg11-31 TaxID=2057808 RepID=UPI000C301B55|nr:hypothetical protein [Lacinutrix sp. Bg11-31]AUC81132.1 hypothetical protein CW733_02885 [Lacinutrix sp. Bg11-31]